MNVPATEENTNRSFTRPNPYKMTVAETIKEAVGLDGTSGALYVGEFRVIIDQSRNTSHSTADVRREATASLQR